MFYLFIYLFSDNTDYAPKFQQIIEVAELEHQKLILKESHDSTPSTESGFINIKDGVKACFKNHLNKDSSSTCQMESKSNVTVPVFIQPSSKLINGKSSETNSSVPCYILNNVSTDKTEVKNINMCKCVLIFLKVSA